MNTVQLAPAVGPPPPINAFASANTGASAAPAPLTLAPQGRVQRVKAGATGGAVVDVGDLGGGQEVKDVALG